MDDLQEIAKSNILEMGLGGAHLSEGVSDDVWAESPADFVTFCESGRFLGKPNGIVPSPNQYRIAFATLGGDPNKCPDPKEIFSEYREVDWTVVVGGKGGGKDLMAAYIICYGVYILLCLRSPQLYLYGYESDVHIDLLNVAQAGKNSQRIFFQYLRNLIKGCPWFMDKYKVREGGGMVDRSKARLDYPEIIMGTNTIHFPYNINAYAETANYETAEGYNTIMWVFDEADALPREGVTVSSNEFFNTFTNTIKTRFGNKGFGMIISWPRGSVDSFVFDKYYEAASIAVGEKRYAHGFRLTTFEMLPDPMANWSGEKVPYSVLVDKDSPDSHFFSKSGKLDDEGKVHFNVPVELLPGNNADVDNFEDFERKILCIPPLKSGALVQYPWRVDECMIPEEEYEPLLTLSTPRLTTGVSGDRYLSYAILGRKEMSLEERSYPRAIFVDKSTHRDITTVMVGYGKPMLISRTDEATGSTYTYPDVIVVVDQVVLWIPDRSEKVQVHLGNVDDIILNMADMVPVKVIGGDKWEPSSPQRFDMLGIPFERKSVRYGDWRNLIDTGIYANRVRFPYNQQLIRDLKTVVKEGETKVSHTDVGLCLAGLFNIIQDPKFMVIAAPRPAPTLARRDGMVGAGRTMPSNKIPTGGDRPVSPEELMQRVARGADRPLPTLARR